MEFRTQDWTAVTTAKVLLIAENSTLQWSEEIIDHVLFLDYYFRSMPYDHGERSRYVEAKTVFDMVGELTAGKYRPEEVYATNLSFDILERPPKGKRALISRPQAITGIEHIKSILAVEPAIEVVFAMSLQVNYWLQELGFYGVDNADFLHGAQPRNAGLNGDPPYYQPVDAKVFGEIIGKPFGIPGSSSTLFPLLGPRDYPLSEANLQKYGGAYDSIMEFFEKKK